MKSKKITYLLIVLLAAAVGFIAYQNFIAGNGSGSTTTTFSSGEEEQQLWTCGMHPEIISEEPGNCPICGMKLTPMKGDGQQQTQKEGVVSIDPVVQQNMNLKTEKVELQNFSSTVETSAILDVDERREHIITSKTSGWVEKLYVDYTGKKVYKGQKLMDIYSPELVSAQQELAAALKYKKSLESSKNNALKESGSQLVENSIRKLKLLEVSQSDIDNLIETGEVKTYITLYSPAGGTVLEKNVIKGQKINAGLDLMYIADLSYIWVLADAYESDLSKISVGDKAEVYINSIPGETFTGKISFIYPAVDTKSRTVKVRIGLPNSRGELKPDMLARVVIKGEDFGRQPGVPEDAVIRTGKSDLVILALGDGKFKPQPVELGIYSDGYYMIKDGLQEGAEIVTSAQFLIDSESKLKSAVGKFTGGHDHGSMTGDEDMTEQSESEHQDETHDSPLLRTSTIDVEAIDRNGDGMLYECPMDWNVLSDDPGRCPLCEMKLKEFTINEVKANLKDHGYQYKEKDQPDVKIHVHQEEDKPENEHGVESPLIRTGIIAVASIDKNGDGKLYQCPMDWNVIADEYQRCPVCEMKMKEYTLDEAEENLDEHGYDYKERIDEHEGHDHETPENEYGGESPLIRTGLIDLEAIDKDGDGKLYECPMDWNVIADKYQRCPVCEMKMKEYTLPEIKKNLDKYGYEYKN